MMQKTTEELLSAHRYDATPFPIRLHECLEFAYDHNLQDIASWNPHGRSFVVNDPEKFVEILMPRFFNQTKFGSFQRQLNIYGFTRITHEQERGSYYHLCFVRGQRNLTRQMVRVKIKGQKRIARNSGKQYDFYHPAWRNHQDASVPPGVKCLDEKSNPLSHDQKTVEPLHRPKMIYRSSSRAHSRREFDDEPLPLSVGGFDSSMESELFYSSQKPVPLPFDDSIDQIQDAKERDGYRNPLHDNSRPRKSLEHTPATPIIERTNKFQGFLTFENKTETPFRPFVDDSSGSLKKHFKMPQQENALFDMYRTEDYFRYTQQHTQDNVMEPTPLLHGTFVLADPIRQIYNLRPFPC